MTRIARTFTRLKKEGGKAFIPYIMAGDPSLARTKKLVRLLEECGADIVELGVPFRTPWPTARLSRPPPKELYDTT